MIEQDLIKKAAEIIGKEIVIIKDEVCIVWKCPDSRLIINIPFDPIKDDRQLNMVREKLWELNFQTVEDGFRNFRVIAFTPFEEPCGHRHQITKGCHFNESINLTTLTAYVEAFEKWKATQ